MTGRHTDRHTDTRTHPRQVRQPAGASSSTRARVLAPVRGRGQRKGRETQRQKETKVHRRTRRLREGDAGRQTCPRAHTYTHTHTERHRWRGRNTERLTENWRRTRERAWHPIRDRHTGADLDTSQREAMQKKQLLQGRGSQPWARPQRGWQLPVGSPRLFHSRGLKGSLRLCYLRQDLAPTPWPEGECVGGRGCGRPTGARWIPRKEGAGCGGRGWEACVVLLLSVSLFLHLPYLGFQALDLSGWQDVCVCVCVLGGPQFKFLLWTLLYLSSLLPKSGLLYVLHACSPFSNFLFLLFCRLS